MSLLLAKKKDKAVQKKVQSLLRSKANKKCFDCPAKNPTFVNTNLQTFICTRCACLVREIGFRARLASSGKFTGAEVVELQYGGNEVARKIWLSSYVLEGEEPTQDDDVRNFMVQKYFEKKWLDNVLYENHQQKTKDRVSKSFTEDGLPIETKYRSKVDQGFSRLRLIDDDEEQELEINNQIEEEIIEDLTPEATKSSSSVSSSRFTLNPSKFFSSFSLTKRSLKSKNQEGEEVTPPSSPVSMTVTSTEENENIDFVSPAPSPTHSTSSFRSSHSNHEPITPVAEPMTMMVPPPPTRNVITEQKEPKVVVDDATNLLNTTDLLSIDVEEKTTNVSYQQQQYSQQQYQQQQQPQQQTRRSEELPSSKINYSNIIQPVPPAKCARFSAPPPTVTHTNNAFSNIMSELSGLHLEKSFGNVAYSGSVLSPTSAYQPMKPMTFINKEEPVKKETSLLDFSFSSPKKAAETKYDDIYQAIRSIPAPQPTHLMNQESSSSEDEDEDDPWQEFCSSSSVDEEPWQEFCSASSVDDNSVDENMITEVKKMECAKPTPFPVVVNLFEDLDPFSVSRRF
ncbi:hypothetical protein K501DRAFT_258817 [Backusella circina FSU 941]|nr:hypothetical protein K501DRAFT_258817 [Backusella circina FSU 941]